jgi:hypothetical protein
MRIRPPKPNALRLDVPKTVGFRFGNGKNRAVFLNPLNPTYKTGWYPNETQHPVIDCVENRWVSLRYWEVE